MPKDRVLSALRVLVGKDSERETLSCLVILSCLFALSLVPSLCFAYRC